MGKTNDNQKEKKDSGSGAKLAIIAIIGVIIILLLVIVIILLLRNGKDAGADATAQNENTREVAGSVRTIASEEDARNVMDEMREEVAEGMFKCDMPSTWTFTKGGTEPDKDLYVSNHPDNTKPIYFDVFLEDTDELLYSSPVLKVGTVWTDISLNRELEPGTYRAKVAFKLLTDEESQEEYSAVNFIVRIKVLN
ncbi:MAG: hypothetical protein K6E50_00750 [Lachnospiraceae bacterium]|nr:hypothetical protein [Lachnospiraceae bacterium]